MPPYYLGGEMGQKVSDPNPGMFGKTPTPVLPGFNPTVPIPHARPEGGAQPPGMGPQPVPIPHARPETGGMGTPAPVAQSPNPNLIGAQGIRASQTSGFDPAYAQNLATNAGGLFAHQGNLNFNPFGNLSDIPSQSVGFGNAPSPGLPQTWLQQALMNPKIQPNPQTQATPAFNFLGQPGAVTPITGGGGGPNFTPPDTSNPFGSLGGSLFDTTGTGSPFADIFNAIFGGGASGIPQHFGSGPRQATA